MFNPNESKKGDFLEQTKAAREERAQEKRRELAVTSIQAFVRGWMSRKRFSKEILISFDEIVYSDVDKTKPKAALQLYQAATRLLLVLNLKRDKERFEKLISLLVESLNLDSTRHSYVGVALSREHAIPWITHIKKLLWHSCLYLDQLSPDFALDSRSMLLHLRVLVAFTSTASWALLKNPNMERLRPGMNQLCANVMGDLFSKGFYKILERLLLKGLCGSKVVLQNIALTAIINLSIRPLASSGFSSKLLSLFLIHILSVPAVIYHLNIISVESINSLISHKIFPRSIELLSSEQDLRIVFNALEGNYGLCLLGNLIQMAHIERDGSLREIYYPAFTSVVTTLLGSCQRYVSNKQSNLTHWHPVLGWFAQYLDPKLHASLPTVRIQLAMLWGAPLASILLGDLTSIVQAAGPPIKTEPTDFDPLPFSALRKVFFSESSKSDKKNSKLGSPDFVKVSRMAALYQTALGTLTQLRLDILTGLCYRNNVLHLLWQYLCTLGPGCGMTTFLDLFSSIPTAQCPEFQLLILFCDCMTHYVTILDDIEMYELQHPFKLDDFVFMSDFLNQFLYKGLLEELFVSKKLGSNALFQSMHTLLMMLYRRDCIRQYTPKFHWLIRGMSVRSFINELEKSKHAYQVILQKMPHIIPQEERVQLFRRYITNEKGNFGITEHGASAGQSHQSTLITIHRSRIVEDGYRQLALLPSAALKSVIRVRFVNEQGLFEAGIDQDGVFKEFLEEIVKRVFDPSLNLFRVTSEERLYPSPTSSLQENHLQLFEFVGRMLGKAVYEGIVVDVPFASFFLSQMLGTQHQAFYSAIDELPSLDAELYRSLTYIKHHEGDVSDLELTFSIDQDYLGKLQTFELVPGGRAIPVTNENKINYIHLMAHFRMHTQIKEQTAAFMKGFRSIINIEWLSLFSPPELQRMISGDNAPLDLKDLRRHTHYYGGFHDSHRVIGWLWDVLAKDFSEQERRQFLKFVTSCSKPPLLGFAHLEPPFSIRCVEVSDDDDTGDTIGSVIRGFFTIRKKDPQNRLPTSSTCFNLLKLPNYQRKSTLRDKLRCGYSNLMFSYFVTVFMTVDACKASEVRVMLLMEFIIQPVPVVNEMKVSLGEYDSEHFSGLGILICKLICNILSAQWGKERKTTSLLISASRLIGVVIGIIVSDGPLRFQLTLGLMTRHTP